MSEWKVGDKAYLQVEVVSVNRDGNGLIRVETPDGHWDDCNPCYLVRQRHLLQPSPVDVSVIRVGDEVTVRGNVARDAIGSDGVVVVFDDDNSFVPQYRIVSHTPATCPSTLAEFDAMTPERRERWFAEITGSPARSPKSMSSINSRQMKKQE